MVRSKLGGITVTYKPASGDPVSVDAMFDAPFTQIRRDDASVEEIGPSIFVRLADLPADPAQDDPTITIDGQDYVVRGREVDGMGGIRLRLHEVDPAPEGP